MNGSLRIVLAAFLALMAATFSALAGEGVVVIPLKGEISEAKFFFLRRALKEAAADNARAVVLDMDTYGGSYAAAEKMQRALAQVKTPTFTYINPNAGSAGALIAVSTQKIYMAPMSAIGAAAPVSSSGEDLPETLRAKSISYYSGYFRSVAEKNGHNPDVTEAFINKDHPVIIGEKTVHEKGSLLTLSAQEAVKTYDGKPLLAAGIADSIADLLRQARIEGVVREVQPTHFEAVAFWITTLAPLFLLGGILGAWIELKAPGFGLPGIFSLVCFALFFTGHYIAGLAGWEAPVIFAIGFVLVLAELFLLPGMIAGVVGVFLMIGAIVWAMIDRFPGQAIFPGVDALMRPLINLGLAGVLALAAIALLARYLPKTALYRRFILDAYIPDSPSFPAEYNNFSGIAVGAEGVAATILRPSGRGEFSGGPCDVVTQGDFIEQGTPIRVILVEGSRVVVARAK